MFDHPIFQRRTLEQTYYPFSETCKGIMTMLLNLATSHYSEVSWYRWFATFIFPFNRTNEENICKFQVRIKSQAILGQSFYMFPYSQIAFLSPLLELLKKDPTVAHEQFKVSFLSVLWLSPKLYIYFVNRIATLLYIQNGSS